jgi:hypothetical protein
MYTQKHTQIIGTIVEEETTHGGNNRYEADLEKSMPAKF